MKNLKTIYLVILFLVILNMPCLSESIQQPVISGIVTDPNGVPIEGVEVTAACESIGNALYRLVTPNTWTDKNGHFNLPVDFSDICYNVTFRYMYNNSLNMKITPAETEPLKVQLPIKTSKIVRGVVLDGSDSSPIEGAIVTYFGEYQKFIIEKISDEKGQFEFTRLPQRDSQAVIYAKHDGKVSALKLVNRENPLDLQLKLDKGVEISGTIKSESTNKPIENCIVSSTTFFSSGYSVQTTTDENGSYEFSDLPPSEYKVTAQNEDYFKYEEKPVNFSDRMVVNSGQKIQKDISLKKRVKFEGKIVDQNGKPVTDAIIAIDESRAASSYHNYSPYVVHTDKKGKFSITTGRIDITPQPELSGLEALKHIILDPLKERPSGDDAIEVFSSTAGYGRYQFAPYREGAIISGVKIQLSQTIRVHGKVTDTNGIPVKDVKIFDQTEFYTVSKTDENGKFDLGKLPIRWPDKKMGTIEFLAPRPESTRVINQRAVIIKSSDMENKKIIFYHHKKLNYDIEPGKDINLNVILEQTELITLKGKVTDENKLPVRNASIIIFVGNADPNTWYETIHPVLTSGSIREIYDRDICYTKTDNNGLWEITTTRETKEGIKLAYWSESSPNLFSIGVETQDEQTVLIQDVNIQPNETEKEINIILGNNNSPEQ